MITHIHTRVEPTPTLADYPTAIVAQLARQAGHALYHQAARLGGRYFSPATLRTIRDTALDELRDRDHATAITEDQASNVALIRDDARVWMANERWADLHRWAGAVAVQPVTDKYLNAVARDELHKRAARLDSRRTAWLERHHTLVLGEILAGASTDPIEYALRPIITPQTLRDELHTRALRAYAADPGINGYF